MNRYFLFHSIVRFPHYLLYLFIVVQTLPCFAGGYWEENAYLCQAQDGLPFTAPPFPAKKAGGECDDGDATLFNGLLCASGDQRGCNAVKNAQTADGKFWRSPRRAETNNLGKGDSVKQELSFSPDQDLGVLLYVVSTGDKGALQRWLNWLENNRPPAAFGLKGLPRYCIHANCTLRPIDRDMLNEVANFYGLDNREGIAHYYARASQLSLGFIDILLGKYGANYLGRRTTDKISSHAALEDSGFPLHLNAVRTLILRKLGNKDAGLDTAVAHLTRREANNPFFQYLKQGATQAVADQVIQYCPSYGQPLDDPNNRDQYTWEQGKSSQWSKPFKKDGKVRGMIWDCIMMKNLSPTLYPNINPAVLSVITNLLLEDEPCNVTVTPASQPVTYQGGDFTANVTAPASCAWTASSSSPWLTIIFGASGKGSGTVQYQVATNTSYKPTTYTLTVTGDNSQLVAIGQDANPGITINNVSLLEGKLGTFSTATFEVKLNMPSPQPVTVSYATKDGTAKSGFDYTVKAGNLTFSKGQTLKTIKVQIKGDNTVEKNETFSVLLSNPSTSYGLIKSDGVALIKNDD